MRRTTLSLGASNLVLGALPKGFRFRPVRFACSIIVEFVFQLLAAFSRLVELCLDLGQRLARGLLRGLLLLGGVIVAPSLNLGFQFRRSCGNALDTCLATLVCVCVCV